MAKNRELQSESYALAQMWKEGVGSVSTNNIISFEGDEWPLINDVLLVNMPQIIISFVYVFYNNCLTRMLLGHEYTSYASNRKPLRVSRPEGKQRSTYRLQLPYRYSVPLLTAMATLHWLVARSIFLVQINIYDTTSLLDYSSRDKLSDSERNGDSTGAVLYKKVSACGYSSMAILLAVVVGGIIILALVANGFRKLDPGMPLASSCSLAITAACHPSSTEENPALLPLKYGVLPNEQIEGDGEKWEHACFSSEEVTPLVDKHVYA